jgi:hypothetical protein
MHSLRLQFETCGESMGTVHKIYLDKGHVRVLRFAGRDQEKGFPASSAQHPWYKQCDSLVVEAVGSLLEQSLHSLAIIPGCTFPKPECYFLEFQCFNKFFLCLK